MTILFSKTLPLISSSDLDELCALQIPEGEQVEYKQYIPGKAGPDPWHTGANKINDHGRDKILAEIVAFANTRGGHVLVGIEESADKPKRAKDIVPIPRCHDAADRLRQQAHAVIEPPLGDLQFHAVPVNSNGDGVVVIRVGRSRNAPHRLKGDRMECYTRRGDSTEPLTMREIQDLTLNVSRGLEGLDKRMAVLQSQFEKHAQPDLAGIEQCKVGIRCSLVPTSPLLMTRDAISKALAASRRDFVLRRTSGAEQRAQIPVLGYNSRPVLRGLTISNVSPGSYYSHSLFVDGAQSCEVVFAEDRTQSHCDIAHLEWILGVATSGLHVGAEVATLSESPATEFCVELQVCAQGAPPRLGIHENYLGQSRRIDESNTVFPRYSFTAEIGAAPVLASIANDCLNAAGLTESDPIAEAKW